MHVRMQPGLLIITIPPFPVLQLALKLPTLEERR